MKTENPSPEKSRDCANTMHYTGSLSLMKFFFKCSASWWADTLAAILPRHRVGTFEQNLSQPMYPLALHPALNGTSVSHVNSVTFIHSARPKKDVTPSCDTGDDHACPHRDSSSIKSREKRNICIRSNVFQVLFFHAAKQSRQLVKR